MQREGRDILTRDSDAAIKVGKYLTDIVNNSLISSCERGHEMSKVKSYH